jgi:ketosteroid isomerase-like protein
MLHPEIVMVFPGFAGRSRGREQFLAGFHDFRRNAKIDKFSELEREVDVTGDTAIVTFRYDMIYELAGERYHSTGRDLWVFQNEESQWIAVWRTMLDMEETPAGSGDGD